MTEDNGIEPWRVNVPGISSPVCHLGGVLHDANFQLAP